MGADSRKGSSEKDFRQLIYTSIRQADKYLGKKDFESSLAQLNNARGYLDGVGSDRNYARLSEAIKSEVDKLVAVTEPGARNSGKESKLVHHDAIGLGMSLSGGNMDRRAKGALPRNWQHFTFPAIFILAGVSLLSASITGAVIGVGQNYSGWMGSFLFIFGVFLALLTFRKR